eukprot:g19751.t1
MARVLSYLCSETRFYRKTIPQKHMWQLFFKLQTRQKEENSRLRIACFTVRLGIERVRGLLPISFMRRMDFTKVFFSPNYTPFPAVHLFSFLRLLIVAY